MHLLNVKCVSNGGQVFLLLNCFAPTVKYLHGDTNQKRIRYVTLFSVFREFGVTYFLMSIDLSWVLIGRRDWFLFQMKSSQEYEMTHVSIWTCSYCDRADGQCSL